MRAEHSVRSRQIIFSKSFYRYLIKQLSHDRLCSQHIVFSLRVIRIHFPRIQDAKTFSKGFRRYRFNQRAYQKLEKAYTVTLQWTILNKTSNRCVLSFFNTKNAHADKKTRNSDGTFLYNNFSIDTWISPVADVSVQSHYVISPTSAL